jgi:phytoene dehydrogenase-like protein
MWARAAAIVDPWRHRAPPTLGELFASVRGSDDESLLERLLTTGFADLLDEWFESEHVKAALVHSGDVGDPRGVGTAWPAMNLAGGAIDVLAEAGETVGIVQGGMGSISAAIAAEATARGATIRTSAPVRRVLVEDGRAVGVQLEDGSLERARIVVSNADPKRTFLGLVGPDHLPAEVIERVRRLRTRVAYLKFHAAMRRLPDLSRFLSPDAHPRTMARVWLNPSVAAYEQAWRDAADGRPSREPVMSIQIPSLYDPTIAPHGRHVLSIFAMYAPVHPRDGTWDELRQPVGEALIDAVCVYAPDFRDAIEQWQLFTPLDIERRVGMTDGNIHHLDMIPSQLFSMRPLPGWSDYRTPIDGLWMCGAGTHPGGEVSGVPGHNAAHAILDAEGARAG